MYIYFFFLFVELVAEIGGAAGLLDRRGVRVSLALLGRGAAQHVVLVVLAVVGDAHVDVDAEREAHAALHLFLVALVTQVVLLDAGAVVAGQRVHRVTLHQSKQHSHCHSEPRHGRHIYSVFAVEIQE